MSVVNPVRYSMEPELALFRLSHELPSQAIGPCTRCATSTIGCSAILAPSKAQPPAAAPGASCLLQPFLRSFSDLPWFLSHPGSSKTSCTFTANARAIFAPRCPAPCPRLADDVERVVGRGDPAG